MRKILSRVSASTAAAITVAAGLTGVVSASTYNGYGGPSHHPQPSSYWSKSIDKTTVKNKSNVDVSNTNSQSASSGRVEVEGNATAGPVSSGAAKNTNSFTGSVSIDNSSASSAALSGDSAEAYSQPSNNHSTMTHISNVSKTYVSNYTDLNIQNTNNQTATSGNVEAEDNSTVGSVSSGDATNNNSTNLSFSVTN